MDFAGVKERAPAVAPEPNSTDEPRDVHGAAPVALVIPVCVFAVSLPSPWLLLVALAGVGLIGVAGLLILTEVAYTGRVARMFASAPVFQPLRIEPDPGGEDVRFETSDGLTLVGTYYRASTPARAGVVVFCHEFLGDRHSAYEYVGGLREYGFDLFSFDCRNHGDSQHEPGYEIIQWVSDRELIDLRAALDYLKTRPDADPAGVALVGVSRGGGTALCLAGQDPSVWAVVTDGAFPTSNTMLHYVRRWACILVSPLAMRLLPDFVYRFVTWSARRRLGKRLNRTFPPIEKLTARIPPRPWLAIHGEADKYIEAVVLEELVRKAGASATTQVWIVPEAKHNRCRETEPEEYLRRLASFLTAAAPRRIETVTEAASAEARHDRQKTRDSTTPSEAAVGMVREI